ncbi:MAG: ABC transporter permease [Panacagrimonas sp.]
MNDLAGAISGMTARSLRGWAFLRGEPAPLTLALWVNGAEMAQVEAVEARNWLTAKQAHPDGRCGFSFRLKADQAMQEGDEVSIRVAGTDSDIPGSPFRFTRARARAIKAKLAPASNARPSAKPTLVARSDDGHSRPSPPTPEEVAEMRSIAQTFARTPPRSSWVIFGHSVLAFLLREIRDRFGRSQFGYVWAILQPILYMLGFTALRQLVRGGKNDIYGVSGMYFFWLGLIPFFMFMHGLNRGLGSTRSAKALFQFRQVQPIDVMLVRVLIEFLTMILVFVILTTGFVWFDQAIDVDNVLGFAAVIATFFLFTMGCVLLAEVCIVLYPESRQMIQTAERPLLLISGTFFTIDHMSPAVREWLLWNPLLHGTDLARGTMLSRYDPLGSWGYFLGFGLLVFALGLAAYRRQAKRLIDQ